MPGLRDYRGRAVEVTDDGWQRILTRHPEMGSRLAEIEAAITAPVAVTRANHPNRCENHYGRAGDRLLVRVSVIYRPTEDGWVGEVLTAHLIRDIVAEEAPLWP